MPVRAVRIGKQTWYQGNSAVSGHPTRLFFNERDAIAEESWLDREWHAVRAFWSTRAMLAEDELDSRATDLLFMLARDAWVGMRLVQLSEELEARFHGYSVFLSNEPRDVDNGLIIAKPAGAKPASRWLEEVPDEIAIISALERCEAERRDTLVP